MNASVGPFTDRAADERATATTGCRRRAQRLAASRAPRGSARSRSPGSTARSRSRAPRRSPRAPRRRRGRAVGAAYSTPSTGPSPRSRIMNSWKARQRPRAGTHVRTGSSRHRQHPRGHAQRAPHLVDAPRSALRRRRSRSARSRHDRQVAVAEVEPDVLAERAQRSITCERVVAQAPAALVDRVGEPERHEVRVGGDVPPWISTSSPVLAITTSRAARTTSSSPRASFAPPVPPAAPPRNPLRVVFHGSMRLAERTALVTGRRVRDRRRDLPEAGGRGRPRGGQGHEPGRRPLHRREVDGAAYELDVRSTDSVRRGGRGRRAGRSGRWTSS